MTSKSFSPACTTYLDLQNSAMVVSVRGSFDLAALLEVNFQNGFCPPKKFFSKSAMRQLTPDSDQNLGLLRTKFSFGPQLSSYSRSTDLSFRGVDEKTCF